MHWVIDIVVALILLFFLLAGWQKGTLLSLLGIVRVILAYGVSFITGRYIGLWLGTVAHRPKIITIPVIAGLTFILITFIFHIVMSNIRDTHLEKEEKEDFRLPWYSCLCGSALNLAVGIFSMIFMFWLADIFALGIAKKSLPGGDKSYFGGFARRAVYEASYIVCSKEGKESQAAAMARVISNPSKGVEHLENVFTAETVQQLISDQQFATDIMSGDPDKLLHNPALEKLFEDRDTLLEMKAIGLLSGKENKQDICDKLSKFGSNETIRTSMESLKAKDLFQKEKVFSLIRDPDFDIIIGELVK